MIEIRVDNQTFYATRDTLCRSPYFQALLLRWEKGTVIHLDMAGQSFEIIINYLRYGFIPSLNGVAKMMLKKDADFLQIQIDVKRSELGQHELAGYTCQKCYLESTNAAQHGFF